MARPAQDVTDTELAILNVLWDQGAVTRRQITDILYPDRTAAQYATVQKLLERLEAKGYVRVDRGANVLTFTAAVERERLIQRRLRDVADKLCGGSLTPLLLNLVRAEKLTPAELEELNRVLADLCRQARNQGKQR